MRGTTVGSIEMEHKMEKSQLEHLYRRVIDQEEYPGEVCPNERNLVRYSMESLSSLERERILYHFSLCRECREVISKLTSARDWFRTNKAIILRGVAEKAIQAGLEPWASCPSQQILENYAIGAIPDTEAGNKFRKHIESHLIRCSDCKRFASSSYIKFKKVIVIKLEELYGRISDTMANTLRELLLGIQEMATVQGIGHGIRAMPGYRSEATSSLQGLLIDKDGRVVLNNEGEPLKVDFALIRAQIERDGHFVLDLSTSDKNYWETPSREFIVSAVLQYENRRLVLPSEKIYSDGRVTIVGNLVSGVEIEDLPLSAIQITVVTT
jgi:hypothetical protein